MHFGLRRCYRHLRRQILPDRYDLRKYWQKRGRGYFNEFKNLSEEDRLRYDTQADLIIKFLSNLDFNSVCEVGCGFGRITKRVLTGFNIAEGNYLAFDLSMHQIQNAKALIGDNVEFRVSALEAIDVRRQYDLVLAVEVLMHVPHQSISGTISKLVNLSSKYIVNVDWKEIDPTKSVSFCFAHDYASLYREHGLKVEMLDLDDAVPELPKKINQKIYCARKLQN